MVQALTQSHPERPIRSQKQDLLDRSTFIDRLCNAVIDPVSSASTGVTVGVTGEWGSGKTSILNLLHECIERRYANAVVVRFDPWLISGRDDLIRQFFAEVVGTINAEPSLKESLKDLADKLADYGTSLSPAADLHTPGLGALVGGGFKVTKRLIQRDTGLHAQRDKITQLLATVCNPIVVMIDELDRVEDGEIRAVAQLVRSIADFPSISYVLAYDVQRVVQALGAGVGDEERAERGRVYLEKIVQFQIPLPVALDEELNELLLAELATLETDSLIPVGWRETERFTSLTGHLIPNPINTPRDIKRLVGTYRVVASMTRGEVEWVDLLAFCCLLIKAPETVAKIRGSPDYVVTDPVSQRVYFDRARDRNTIEDRLKAWVPKSEDRLEITDMLLRLFPCFSSRAPSDDSHPDSLCYRRPLLTVLRLGLLPGSVSRQEAESLLSSSDSKILHVLEERYDMDQLGPLIERINDVYPDTPEARHQAFWMAVSEFFEPEQEKWMTRRGPKQRLVHTFLDVFRLALIRSPDIGEVAREIFHALLEKDDVTLTAAFLRGHIFAHGLFGYDRREGGGTFLTEEEVQSEIRRLSARYRDEHLSGLWLARLWNFDPVYNMLDCRAWDEECRERLDQLIKSDDALDGVSLMLFGSDFFNTRATIERMMDLNQYLTRVGERLNDPDLGGADPSVRVALEKALDPSVGR